MHYVLLGVHSAEVCPTANGRTRDLMMQTGPQIPKIAESAGVKIVAGPFVNREHTTVVVVEASSGEAVDSFIVESRLNQWNSVRILPSLPMEEAMQQLGSQPPLY